MSVSYRQVLQREAFRPPPVQERVRGADVGVLEHNKNLARNFVLCPPYAGAYNPSTNGCSPLPSPGELDPFVDKLNQALEYSHWRSFVDTTHDEVATLTQGRRESASMLLYEPSANDKSIDTLKALLQAKWGVVREITNRQDGMFNDPGTFARVIEHVLRNPAALRPLMMWQWTALIHAVNEASYDDPFRMCMLHHPTGSGKTMTMGKIMQSISDAFKDDPGRGYQLVIVAPRKGADSEKDFRVMSGDASQDVDIVYNFLQQSLLGTQPQVEGESFDAYKKRLMKDFRTTVKFKPRDGGAKQVFTFDRCVAYRQTQLKEDDSTDACIEKLLKEVNAGCNVAIFVDESAHFNRGGHRDFLLKLVARVRDTVGTGAHAPMGMGMGGKRAAPPGESGGAAGKVAKVAPGAQGVPGRIRLFLASATVGEGVDGQADFVRLMLELQNAGTLGSAAPGVSTLGVGLSTLLQRFRGSLNNFPLTVSRLETMPRCLLPPIYVEYRKDPAPPTEGGLLFQRLASGLNDFLFEWCTLWPRPDPHRAHSHPWPKALIVCPKEVTALVVAALARLDTMSVHGATEHSPSRTVQLRQWPTAELAAAPALSRLQGPEVPLITWARADEKTYQPWPPAQADVDMEEEPPRGRRAPRARPAEVAGLSGVQLYGNTEDTPPWGDDAELRMRARGVHDSPPPVPLLVVDDDAQGVSLTGTTHVFVVSAPKSKSNYKQLVGRALRLNSHMGEQLHNPVRVVCMGFSPNNLENETDYMARYVVDGDPVILSGDVKGVDLFLPKGQDATHPLDSLEQAWLRLGDRALRSQRVFREDDTRACTVALPSFDNVLQFLRARDPTSGPLAILASGLDQALSTPEDKRQRLEVAKFLLDALEEGGMDPESVQPPEEPAQRITSCTSLEVLRSTNLDSNLRAAAAALKGSLLYVRKRESGTTWNPAVASITPEEAEAYTFVFNYSLNKQPLHRTVSPSGPRGGVYQRTCAELAKAMHPALAALVCRGVTADELVALLDPQVQRLFRESQAVRGFVSAVLALLETLIPALQLIARGAISTRLIADYEAAKSNADKLKMISIITGNICHAQNSSAYEARVCAQLKELLEEDEAVTVRAMRAKARQ